ncbi:hypothetical protein EDD90_1989 [Streptomyces sp. Ag109_O5-1]|uniref:hypothetical protein n=1 Tax=Streptomyces sp. Ag109_O5-1 TaxID=1938851 RepID=UPI000F513733|nr:hypothetical protein [Streptomyces sp. Ag109_O5-1]RPE39035.1 hypothetical protein EDD90_1989 [Streptomyces sp. Ag109_O5-1]
MNTPAAIAQLAAGILGSGWKAERSPWEVRGSLTAPETDEFTLHVDDLHHLVLEAALAGEIARFTGHPAQSSGEDLARAVAEAIRHYLSTLEDDETQGTALYQELNLGAHFSGADYSDPETPCHPSVTIAGGTCSFYIDEARVAQVVVELDWLTASGLRIWPGGVPVRITLDGGVVFSSTGTWVVELQHPEDGGDDSVWEYEIAAEDAPTEADARTVAAKRLLADLKSRDNADAWNGITIRSVRLADHPPTA